ncbi:hypothetical protein [Phaeovulum vinaykumarii]|uniref:Tellurite resistance protein n=2 Tax=Phaeovulum vinaykumarii TaxID=407234 RepID=A0A1N7LHK8_9RHOB|nr:hypothetical protein [Phaeovulum vinaykumarii]SIS73289.1 tellurite resistance protein [Phaeovulum vinaykumarii]SOC04659.1 tellurite resistance protein [Phaeovulum vinaykumarii]
MTSRRGDRFETDSGLGTGEKMTGNGPAERCGCGAQAAGGPLAGLSGCGQGGSQAAARTRDAVPEIARLSPSGAEVSARDLEGFSLGCGASAARRDLSGTGLGRRMPPAVFLPVLGLVTLGLVWRQGIGDFALPRALASMGLGALTFLFAALFVAYVIKLARRPRVLFEELRILPGRAGVAAAVLGVDLCAAALGPYLPDVARMLLMVGLGLHVALVAAAVWTFHVGVAEQRRASPVWHLQFTGPLVVAWVGQGLGLDELSRALFWLTLPVALSIWALCALQLRHMRVPEVLRPLMVLHLAPLALMGLVAHGAGYTLLAQGMGLAALALTALFAVSSRWLLAAGPGPMWGTMGFPLAVTAGLWLTLDGPWRLFGDLALVGTTLVILPISLSSLRDWVQGRMARTTAAAAA